MLAIVLLTSGCLWMAARRPVEPGRRIATRSFSVLPPKPEGWFLTTRAADGVWFDRPTPEGKWHTVMAFAMLDPRPLPAGGLDAVEGRSQAEALQAILQGIKIVSQSTRRVEAARHRCVESIFEVEDPRVPGADGVLRMVGVDRFCVQRDEPGARVIHLGYSQRLRPTDATLPIDAESRAFLDSLDFERRD